MTREPGLSDEDVAPFSSGFAERVLRTAERTRRRQRLVGLAVAALIAIVVGSSVRVRSHAVPVLQRDSLTSADFAWLEDVGAQPSTPSAVVFPDDRETSETSRDENLLVAVAENI